MTAFSASNSALAISMDSIPQFGGTIITNSSTQITVVSGSFRQNYYGEFSYTSGGEVNGRLTGTDFVNAVTGMSYSLSNFSFDANIASKYVLSGSAQILSIDLLAGNDTIVGSNFGDRLFGYSGNDIIAGGLGNDRIDGGAGIDTVIFNSARSQAQIVQSTSGLTVSENRSTTATDTLFNVERLKFADSAIAFDVTANAGQAYRLYRAALDRTPDAVGLGAQINGLDAGMSLLQVAQNFINSAEFQSKYGVGLSNAAFVSQLYNNVLHRAPDPTGYAVQVNALNSGMSRAQLLINFSESNENFNATLVGVANGIEYIPVV